jgi:hypothetical protein
MNTNFIRYSLLVILIAVVGPCIQRTAAQSIQSAPDRLPSRLILIEQHMPPVGLAFGQSFTYQRAQFTHAALTRG